MKKLLILLTSIICVQAFGNTAQLIGLVRNNDFIRFTKVLDADPIDQINGTYMEQHHLFKLQNLVGFSL